MAGKGGGAWKVAYADFVTAMMAFFLVMWIVGQNKPMKEAIAGYFRDPFGHGQGPGGENGGGGDPKSQDPSKDARIQVLLSTKKDAARQTHKDPEALAARKAFLLKLHQGERIAIGAVVDFAEGSIELSEDAKARLAEVAPLLRGKPNKIELRGHSSSLHVPEESAHRDPWSLCFDRCRATRDFLADQGVEPERMRLSQAAANEPRIAADGRDAQARNARVEVFLLSEHLDDFRKSGPAHTGSAHGPIEGDSPPAPHEQSTHHE